MKYLVILLALSACATTSSSLTADRPDIRDYCGEVGPFSVYADQSNGFVDCPVAVQVTSAAYTFFQQKIGNIREPWDVEYTYKYLQFVDFDFKTPWSTGFAGTIPTGPGPMGTRAITYGTEHVIKVREGRPRSIFHELLHAYMHENMLGKNDEHRTICSTHTWWRAEADFAEWPHYCYDSGGVK